MEHAAANCKVLVAANQADIIALVLKKFAPSIPEKNITCLSRLDHNRALCQISEKLGVPVSEVENVIIWGKYSSIQHPDVSHATVKTPSGKKPVRELIKDGAWLDALAVTIRQRGTEINRALDYSCALSLSRSICDHVCDWACGTPEGAWVSMALFSDGSYNVPPGLIYSFPATCQNGEWRIVQGLCIDEPTRKKLAIAGELFEKKFV